MTETAFAKVYTSTTSCCRKLSTISNSRPLLQPPARLVTPYIANKIFPDTKLGSQHRASLGVMVPLHWAGDRHGSSLPSSKPGGRIGRAHLLITIFCRATTSLYNSLDLSISPQVCTSSTCYESYYDMGTYLRYMGTYGLYLRLRSSGYSTQPPLAAREHGTSIPKPGIGPQMSTPSCSTCHGRADHWQLQLEVIGIGAFFY
jgi:hypothetical protein